MPGKLILIPVPIAENALHTLPAEVFMATKELQYFFAENARTSRRFLKQIHPELVMETLQFSEIDKHTGPDFALLKKWLGEGLSVGVMSEAGCPGIADPGSELVAIAHQAGAIIKPLTGPNSMMLALMASGLDGQRFAFHGYLPVKDPARSTKIKSLETSSAKEQQTQLFIETPYRNNALLADLLKTCAGPTKICIAQNLSGENEYVRTATVAQWKKQVPELEKSPAVFLMLA